MIRNVVVGTLRPGVRDAEIERALQALRDLHVAGIHFSLVAGRDVGLRPGNAGYAVTADFRSADDYRAYDLDPEHNRIREEMFVPISERIERIQFELSGPWFVSGD
jgi:hypothetical protein